MESIAEKHNSFMDSYNKCFSGKTCHLDYFKLGKVSSTYGVGNLQCSFVRVVYGGKEIGEIAQIHSPIIHKKVVFEYDKGRLSDKFVSLLGCEKSCICPIMAQSTSIFVEVEEAAEFLRGLLLKIAPNELFAPR